MAIITVAIMTTVMRIIATTPPIIVALSSSSVANVVIVRMHRMILYIVCRTDMCRSTGRLVVIQVEKSFLQK